MSIDAVILAAGYSGRAGVFKPAVEINGKSLLHHTIDSVTAHCEHIIIVGGYQFEKIVALLENYPETTIVMNNNYAQGMFSSVQRGLREVTADHFFILPGDQPAIQPNTIHQIAECHAEIVQPRCNGKKGHPVKIHSRYLPELLSMPETAVLRDFMHAHDPFILDVDDPGINMDADTPEDIQRLQNHMKKERK